MSKPELVGLSDFALSIPVSTHPQQLQVEITDERRPSVMSYRPPKATASTVSSPASPSRRRKSTYECYAVTAGKRTGIFADWSYVCFLTQGVSKNSQKGFKTYDDALAYYERAKRMNVVQVIGRENGDEVVLGPLAEAEQ